MLQSFTWKCPNYYAKISIYNWNENSNAYDFCGCVIWRQHISDSAYTIEFKIKTRYWRLVEVFESVIDGIHKNSTTLVQKMNHSANYLELLLKNVGSMSKQIPNNNQNLKNCLNDVSNVLSIVYFNRNTNSQHVL